jgi:hypothetical protein
MVRAAPVTVVLFSVVSGMPIRIKPVLPVLITFLQTMFNPVPRLLTHLLALSLLFIVLSLIILSRAGERWRNPAEGGYRGDPEDGEEKLHFHTFLQKKRLFPLGKQAFGFFFSPLP